MADYKAGNYSSAVDALQTAYDLASKEGTVRIMLEAMLFLGNAYCNRQDLPNMERHYRVVFLQFILIRNDFEEHPQYACFRYRYISV